MYKRQPFDSVRIFINDHSQDKIDAVFRAMNGNALAFADGLIAHARDPSVERVHMECSTRANLMDLLFAPDISPAGRHVAGRS